MVLAAAKLLRQRGVTATGIRDVVDLARSPRGSVQHYFPGGKDQLITEALALVAAQIAQPLNAAETGSESATVFEVFALMIESWRHFLRSSDYSSGCPIASVVVDSSALSEPLREAARDAFQNWERPLRAALRRSGVDRVRAASMSTTILACVEGAILLARAQHKLNPLNAVEAEMKVLLAGALNDSESHP